jgi:hypothetical protein
MMSMNTQKKQTAQRYVHSLHNPTMWIWLIYIILSILIILYMNTDSMDSM